MQAFKPATGGNSLPGPRSGELPPRCRAPGWGSCSSAYVTKLRWRTTASGVQGEGRANGRGSLLEQCVCITGSHYIIHSLCNVYVGTTTGQVLCQTLHREQCKIHAYVCARMYQVCLGEAQPLLIRQECLVGRRCDLAAKERGPERARVNNDLTALVGGAAGAAQ